MSHEFTTRVAIVLLCLVCVETTWILSRPPEQPAQTDQRVLDAVNASHETELLAIAELKSALKSLSERPGKPIGNPLGASNE